MRNCVEFHKLLSHHVGGTVTLSPLQVAMYYALLLIGFLLLVGYGYEYVRYKTLRKRGAQRRFNVLFCIWLGVIGIYGWFSISPVLGLVFIGLALLCYFWDRWIVDRMP